MKDEYIIINKSHIIKRLNALKGYFKERQLSNIESVAYNHTNLELKDILANSTPLIPEIDKAYEAGKLHEELSMFDDPKGRYISNLKFNI